MVSQAVRFLSSVVSKKLHSRLFEAPDVLQALCKSVVLPNMALREAEEEVFEDNPSEYIVRDIEGSNAETRRHAASTMVKGLTVNFEAAVSSICMSLVEGLMQEYNTDPENKWREKDAAIALLSSLAAKSSHRSKGVTEVNAHVDILTVLKTYIVSELHMDAAAIATELPTGKAILKATCLNFVTAFRSQWPSDILQQLLPLVTQWLQSPMYVLHSYAAVCVERLLSVTDPLPQGAPAGTKLPRRASDDTIKSILNPGLSAALARIASVGQVDGSAASGAAGVLGRQDGNGENEWMMRLVLRLLVCAGASAAGVAGDVLGVLSKVITAVTANPAAPQFNHYLFESVAVVIKCVVDAQGGDAARVNAAVGELESNLMPVFDVIFSKDVTEFVPYSFQLLASLLAHKSIPAQGGHALSDTYIQLLDRLLAATLWERRSNVPALTMLVCTYLAKGGSFIVQQEKLMPILGVFQKLISAASTEDSAHRLIRAVVSGVPLGQWSALAPQALSVLIMRMQNKRSLKTAKAFIETLALMAGRYGGTEAIGVLDAVLPGLFHQLASSVIGTHANAIVGVNSRKTVAIGLAALCEAPALLSGEGLPSWRAITQAGVQLLEARADHSAAAAHAKAAAADVAAEAAAEVAHFDATFARLTHVVIPGGRGKGGVDYFSDVPDARTVWANKIAQVVKQVGVAQWPTLTQGMDAGVVGVLKQYCQAAGVNV